MPAGKGKPAGGYHAGAKGSYGCNGFPTVSADGTVHGCHPTKAQAQAQARAIFASTAQKFISIIEKSMPKEGDFVIASGEDEVYVGIIQYVMTDGMFGIEYSDYSLKASTEEPVVLVRILEFEEGYGWDETENLIGVNASMITKIEPLFIPDLQNNSAINSEVTMAMYDSQIGKSYYSDNQDEDKWDNMTKKCWVGYEQQGMKEKGGRMVPNCVPVGKLKEMDDDMAKAKPKYEDFIKPRSGGSEPSNPKLYAAVVQAAKDKFDVYPSAVANSWVVQEYKRRGGTYKSESKSTTKSIWGGAFDPLTFEK